MAETRVGMNDSMAVRLWSKKLNVEVSKATRIWPLIGKSADSIIQLKDETSKASGDEITFALRAQLMGDGVSEFQQMEGNEEKTSWRSDRLRINELVHATRCKNNGTIDAQRVPFNLREECNQGLADWYADRISLMFFLQVCGYTARNLTFEGAVIRISNTHYGFNTPMAPSSKRWIIAGNKTSEDQLTADDTFTLGLIDHAVEMAKLANPKIKPVKVGNDHCYVLYLHPKQVSSLRTNTDVGQWLDIQKAAYNGSRGKNPIFDGSLGMYNGVILREAEHIMPAVDANGQENASVRRAVLLGAQSAVIAFGKQGGSEKYQLVEELFDYQREFGVACKTIIGLKKTRYTEQDYATITISTAVTDYNSQKSPVQLNSFSSLSINPTVEQELKEKNKQLDERIASLENALKKQKSKTDQGKESGDHTNA